MCGRVVGMGRILLPVAPAFPRAVPRRAIKNRGPPAEALTSLPVLSPPAAPLVPPENTTHSPTTSELPNRPSVSGVCLSMPELANSVRPPRTPEPGEGGDGETEARAVRLLPKHLAGHIQAFWAVLVASVCCLRHLGNLGRWGASTFLACPPQKAPAWDGSIESTSATERQSQGRAGGGSVAPCPSALPSPRGVSSPPKALCEVLKM